MHDLLQQDLILSKQVVIKGGVIEARSVGRLVEVIDDARVILFFEGRGRILVPRASIRPHSFKIGQRVRIVGEDEFHTEGVIEDIWTSASSVYMYRVRVKKEHQSFESHRLRTIPETVGEPMVISELASHMIAVGGGCNPNTVPAWFTSVVKSLGNIPKLSQMDPDQLTYIIKNHMSTRVIDNTTDLVANVLFVIQAHPTADLRKMEERLYGYKEKLDAEWKRLDKIVPIEFQFAALKAYAETK